jgi:hypothetical protein
LLLVLLMLQREMWWVCGWGRQDRRDPCRNTSSGRPGADKIVDLGLRDAAQVQQVTQPAVLESNGAGGLLHLQRGLGALSLVLGDSFLERFKQLAPAGPGGSLVVTDAGGGIFRAGDHGDGLVLIAGAGRWQRVRVLLRAHGKLHLLPQRAMWRGPGVGHRNGSHLS